MPNLNQEVLLGEERRERKKRQHVYSLNPDHPACAKSEKKDGETGKTGGTPAKGRACMNALSGGVPSRRTNAAKYKIHGLGIKVGSGRSPSYEWRGNRCPP